MKLHLGCGQRYFNGYINIDYPLTEHSAQQTSVADEFANLFELCYTEGSVDEVRLHHVFEHFSRAQACALLVSWNSWLKVGGILHIEVPDFKRTAQAAISSFSSSCKKFVALRHIFGSQEAHWAVHYQGYSKFLLVNILETFGFKIKKVSYNNWKGTYNIEIIAVKALEITESEGYKATTKYLSQYMVSNVESEQTLLKTWLGEYEKQLEKTFAKIK
jgi:predicted SAM-dependent methyltransferase